MESNQKNISNDTPYRIRIMVSIVAVEILVLLIFTFWPVEEKADSTDGINISNDVIAINDVIRTTQQNRPPAPPKPQVPLPVPNDEVIQEDPINIDDLNLSEYSDSLSIEITGSNGDADVPVSSPQTSPQIRHIIEPTVPDAAKKADIKVEIWVEFLVDRQGNVAEATISKIKLYDQKTGNSRVVENINYGLTETTIDAALQWKFRPAQNNGKPVKAYTTQVFTYGF